MFLANPDLNNSNCYNVLKTRGKVSIFEAKKSVIISVLDPQSQDTGTVGSTKSKGGRKRGAATADLAATPNRNSFSRP